jgi:hypothetical protein
LIDGHEVNGVEVIDAGAESLAASFEIKSCRMAARAAVPPENLIRDDARVGV